jgi:LCP family protein required for cell wall assembly
MLSIPRDLYVPIPGQSDMQRINAAYALGELQQPGQGPKLAMQTIQYNFGIQVNSYVLVSFEAVIGVVDAIGGIDVDVPKAIDDPEYPDMNYGYDPLYIPAGHIHMDGQLTLKYARTRHQDSDYDRTYRQQQVILAIRQKILKPEVLTQVVGQAPALWNQYSKGLITDFTLDQLLSLGWYVKDIPPSNIKRGTIQDQYAQAVQYQGETVITPNRARIGELMTQLFGPDYSR